MSIGFRSTSANYDRGFIKLVPIGSSGHWVTNFRPNSASRPETSVGHDCVVGENDGVIIVDHGSRRQESNLMLRNGLIIFCEFFGVYIDAYLILVSLENCR